MEEIDRALRSWAENSGLYQIEDVTKSFVPRPCNWSYIILYLRVARPSEDYSEKSFLLLDLSGDTYPIKDTLQKHFKEDFGCRLEYQGLTQSWAVKGFPLKELTKAKLFLQSLKIPIYKDIADFKFPEVGDLPDVSLLELPPK
jgi:hypothetical protein